MTGTHFVILLMSLNLAASLWYGWDGEYWRSAYWLAAFLLNLCVLNLR
jgi:hypothetical protein